MDGTIYEIRPLTPMDITDAVALAREHFLPEETIYRSYIEKNRGTYRSDALEVLTQAFVEFLYQTVLTTHEALVAVNRSNNTIIGLVVMHVGEYQNLTYRPGCPHWPTSVPNGILEKITYYLWDIRENAAVREKFPNTQYHMYFMYLTVHKDHRRLGLGKTLIHHGLQWAIQRNYDLVCGIFTSVESKKIAERAGMYSIFDCDLRAVWNNKQQPVFADAGVNNIVSVMVINLKPNQVNQVPMLS